MLNSDLLRDYPIPSTGKQSIHLFASHTVFTNELAVLFRLAFVLNLPRKDWAPKAIPDDAEPHSKEKINELVYNGSLEKSDMDDEDNQIEHEYIVVTCSCQGCSHIFWKTLFQKQVQF
ncbi:hypothetical protein F2Q69_00053029 [Brassica cretica]|uniref:Uncharacterized protein n=1 Tax=Brassica cretica TaxID=69181 RepID=A0A8S9MVU2_BRACR|nr:hypothetical protein F2Q69_00053029 [Brassica cretica]